MVSIYNGLTGQTLYQWKDLVDVSQMDLILILSKFSGPKPKRFVFPSTT